MFFIQNALQKTLFNHTTFRLMLVVVVLTVATAVLGWTDRNMAAIAYQAAPLTTTKHSYAFTFGKVDEVSCLRTLCQMSDLNRQPSCC